jgi:phage shock protein C
MYCTQCGTQTAETANFCPSCGQQTPLGSQANRNAHQHGAPRRLTRTTYEGKIAGVCSGLARYMDVDVVLIRLLAIAATIGSAGIAVLVYFAAWIVVPAEQYNAYAGQPVTNA